MKEYEFKKGDRACNAEKTVLTVVKDERDSDEESEDEKDAVRGQQQTPGNDNKHPVQVKLTHAFEGEPFGMHRKDLKPLIEVRFQVREYLPYSRGGDVRVVLNDARWTPRHHIALHIRLFARCGEFKLPSGCRYDQVEVQNHEGKWISVYEENGDFTHDFKVFRQYLEKTNLYEMRTVGRKCRVFFDGNSDKHLRQGLTLKTDDEVHIQCTERTDNRFKSVEDSRAVVRIPYPAQPPFAFSKNMHVVLTTIRYGDTYYIEGSYNKDGSKKAHKFLKDGGRRVRYGDTYCNVTRDEFEKHFQPLHNGKQHTVNERYLDPQEDVHISKVYRKKRLGENFAPGERVEILWGDTYRPGSITEIVANDLYNEYNVRWDGGERANKMPAYKIRRIESGVSSVPRQDLDLQNPLANPPPPGSNPDHHRSASS